MGNQEMPKRKYQKHKEGFKVTINHKLNTSLKYLDLGFAHNYPLYVEVRVHRQRSFFPSRFDFRVFPNDFDNFVNNEFVQKFLSQESRDIEAHISEQAAYKDTFDITEWLGDYKEASKAELIETFLIDYTEKFVQNFIDDHRELAEPVSALLDPLDWLENIKNISAIFKCAGETSFANLHDVITSYQELTNLIDYYSPNWLKPEIEAHLNLERSLSMKQILDTDFLQDKLAIMEEGDAIDYLANLEKIRAFVLAVKQNV